MIKEKLLVNKVYEIDLMIKMSLWSPTGKPISPTEFIKQLFGYLPEFFKSESELRKIWSLPDTRKKLLMELSEKRIYKFAIGRFKKLHTRRTQPPF